MAVSKPKKPKKPKKPFVVIRTYSAGVHCGYLESRNGQEVVLNEARRIWRWAGANTLNEISQSGCSETSTTRISVPVPLITLLQVIEVIQCSPGAKANLEKSRWLS